jgi:hypothetical protein
MALTQVGTTNKTTGLLLFSTLAMSTMYLLNNNTNAVNTIRHPIYAELLAPDKMAPWRTL